MKNFKALSCILALIVLAFVFIADASPPENTGRTSAKDAHKVSVNVSAPVTASEQAVQAESIETVAVAANSATAKRSRFDFERRNVTRTPDTMKADIDKPPIATAVAYRHRPDTVRLL